MQLVFFFLLLITQHPDAIQHLHNAGVRYATNRQFQEAIECWSLVLAIEPEYDPALAHRAIAHGMLGHTSEALLDYLASQVRGLDHLTKQWQQAYEEGRYDDVIRLSARINRMRSFKSIGNLIWADALLKRSKFSDCEKMLDKLSAEKMSAEHRRFYHELHAMLYLARKQAKILTLPDDRQSALDHLSKALELSARSPTPLCLRGMIYSLDKETIGDAVRDFRHAVVLDPRNIENRIFFIGVLLNQGSWDEANMEIASLKRKAEELHLLTSDFETAIQRFEEVSRAIQKTGGKAEFALDYKFK